jgi:hypothetical protein
LFLKCPPWLALQAPSGLLNNVSSQADANPPAIELQSMHLNAAGEKKPSPGKMHSHVNQSKEVVSVASQQQQPSNPGSQQEKPR